MRPAVPSDVAVLWRDLRPADAAELRAAGTYDDGEQRLLDTLRAPVGASWALEREGQLLGLFGVGDWLWFYDAKATLVWGLGTTASERYFRDMARDTPAIVKALTARYGCLVNTVHADNRAAVRWLEHVGAEFFGSVEHPDTGAIFYPFLIGGDHV